MRFSLYFTYLSGKVNCDIVQAHRNYSFPSPSSLFVLYYCLADLFDLSRTSDHSWKIFQMFQNSGCVKISFMTTLWFLSFSPGQITYFSLYLMIIFTPLICLLASLKFWLIWVIFHGLFGFIFICIAVSSKNFQKSGLSSSKWQILMFVAP